MNGVFPVSAYQAEQQVRTCLEMLGQRHNIAGLTLEANGSAGLELANGERIYFSLDAEANKLYLYTPFASLRGDLQDQAIDMLRLNCLEAGTHGGVISVSEPMEAFIYHRSLPINALELNTLDQAIEELIKQRQQLAQQF